MPYLQDEEATQARLAHGGPAALSVEFEGLRTILGLKAHAPLPLSEATLLSKALELADAMARRPNVGGAEAPLMDLRRLAHEGFFIAPLPQRYGGLGLGTEAGKHRLLLQILAAFGGGDLSLSRLYEGHVNALILITAYGTAAQLQQAANDARNGMLFGVWNSGGADPTKLTRATSGTGKLLLDGCKLFASGAAFVDRAIVTAECEGAGWQMTLLAMDRLRAEGAAQVDHRSWHPLGMQASESYGIEFLQAPIDEHDLIGDVGDFYREPLFRGGAIRFAAVHAGAVLRLRTMFAEWLTTNRRAQDPYQLARMGEIALAARDAELWVEYAASTAEAGLNVDADAAARECMLACANMMRVRMEQIGTATMQRVAAGAGARGLLQPWRFERIIRDLTMYLRQPGPDEALADIGRATLRNTEVAE